LATSHDTIATALPVPVLLAVSGTIDATSSGPGITPLYTVPSGERAVVTGAIVRLTGVTGFTSVPAVGIGQNAGEDDIFASTTLTGVDTAEETWGFSPTGRAVTVAGGVSIDFGVDTDAVATTYTIVVYLYGHLL
jgi:hypothetical protein